MCTELRLDLALADVFDVGYRLDEGRSIADEQRYRIEDRAFDSVAGSDIVVHHAETGVVRSRVVGDQPELFAVAPVRLARQGDPAWRDLVRLQPQPYATVQRTHRSGTILRNFRSHCRFVGTDHVEVRGIWRMQAIISGRVSHSKSWLACTLQMSLARRMPIASTLRRVRLD